MTEPLTRENFWNEHQVLYPEAIKIFYDWLGEYKVKVNWFVLFRRAIKYQDLPFAMQIGIWMEFEKEFIGGYNAEPGVSFMPSDWRDYISAALKHLNTNPILQL